MKDPDRTAPTQPHATRTLEPEGAQAARTPLAEGTVLAGRYRLGRLLGIGGQGEVYEAEDRELGIRVALKTLRPRRSVGRGPAGGERAGGLTRLKREILLARSVSHPNVCRVYDFGVHRDGLREIAFLSMELLAGESLSRRLARAGALDPEVALAIAIQLSSALAAAHEAGVVHRDFKSGNVMLVRAKHAQERAVVTDFGLALGPRDEAAGSGPMLGTPSYMAPEQVLGEPAGPAADIYALGVVLFEMVTGRLPFRGHTPSDTAQRRLNEAPPSPRALRPSVAPHWEAAILRCLRRSPHERFTSAAELASALGAGTRPSAVLKLARPLTSLVGRKSEIAEVERLSSQAPLVTIVGIGGCGKSRVAAEAALRLGPRLRDGAVWVELAGLDDPARIADAVARRLELPEAEADAAAALCAALAERTLLLVLDNCEHLLEATAALAARLVSECPGLRCLATSREPLALPGERVLRLEPLGLPAPGAGAEELARSDAVRLFLERAVQARPGFALDAASAATIGELCRRLDGLPLALELAAARVRTLSLAQILERLDPSGSGAAGADRFRLLSGPATLAARQRTLRATLDWSWELLGEAERQVLRRASVFAGGFDLAAAEAVCAAPDLEPGAVLDGIASLHDKSLVVCEHRGAETRYTLLESVRAYGLERLAQADEERAARLAHLEHYEALARAALPHWNAAGQLAWARRLTLEHDNLRAAIGFSLASDRFDLAVKLADSLWAFWDFTGQLGEGRRWLEAIVERRGSAAGSRDDAAALNAAGNLAYRQGDHAAARRLWEQSLAICQAVGARHGVAAALNNLALATLRAGDTAAARAKLMDCLATLEELGDRPSTASALINLGNIALERGELAESRRCHERALALVRELGDERGVANALEMLGVVSLREGDLDAARAGLEASHELRIKLGDRQGLADVLANLGDLMRERGDFAAATAHHKQSLRLRLELDLRRGIAEVLAALADVAAGEGRAERAARLLGAADRLRSELGIVTGRLHRTLDERSAGLARAVLGDERLAELRAAGAALSLEAAIAEALSG